MLVFSGVTKVFDTKPVIDDLSFRIKRGEFVVIAGKSGAGKSTIIHMIIGAEDPTSGDISVHGMSLSKVTKTGLQHYRQGLGIVFQDFKLLERKTVFENVAFALEVIGEDPFVIKRKTAEALFMVGLDNMGNRFPITLSGGEKQRVAIARAIVHSPNLLLADEPTGNLDPENNITIAKLLKKLNQENGISIFLTTHNAALISEIQPRILTLENGKITRDLPPGSVLPSYFS
jgi:cell division transport system ATP-binding protein